MQTLATNEKMELKLQIFEKKHRCSKITNTLSMPSLQPKSRNRSGSCFFLFIKLLTTIIFPCFNTYIYVYLLYLYYIFF